MSLPISPLIESPILQELFAVGGTDDVRFLYERLIPYFPSLSDAEIALIHKGQNSAWKKSVQKAGKTLEEKRLIKRNRGIWSLTAAGEEKVSAETSDFTITRHDASPLTHQQIQASIAQIGRILGFYAETEFEFYDVIWRESASSRRISHVFEVQSKGNIDSAFAKLKRAFDAQRSKPFLVLAGERDTNRARRSLENEFRELSEVVSIISFVEIEKTLNNLKQLENILPKLLAG